MRDFRVHSHTRWLIYHVTVAHLILGLSIRRGSLRGPKHELISCFMGPPTNIFNLSRPDLFFERKLINLQTEQARHASQRANAPHTDGHHRPHRVLATPTALSAASAPLLSAPSSSSLSSFSSSLPTGCQGTIPNLNGHPPMDTSLGRHGHKEQD